MEKIFDIRFIVPPILTLFFVFLFSPQYFSDLIINNDKLIETFLIESAIILALGILISSVVNFVVIKLNLRSSGYDKEEKKKIKTYFMLENSNQLVDSTLEDFDILELGSWLVLSNLNKSIQDQVHKRWNWAMANFNYFTALIFSILVILFLLIFRFIYFPIYCWIFVWFILVLLFLMIFFINGKHALNSVAKMDRFLLNNYEKILKTKNDQR